MCIASTIIRIFPVRDGLTKSEANALVQKLQDRDDHQAYYALSNAEAAKMRAIYASRFDASANMA